MNRSHVDLFVPLTPALMAAASAESGRKVGREEAARMLQQAVQTVVRSWTVYGEWAQRVESGAWYSDWQRKRQRQRKAA